MSQPSGTQSWWPKESPSKTKKPFPPTSLLGGLDDVIWDAMAHIDPQLFKGKPQIATREALREIGMGWVAVNTNPLRTAYGAIIDAAAEFYAKNAWRPPQQPLPKLRKVEFEDRQWAPCADED